MYREFEDINNPALIFKCIAGSRAYGTNNINSDTDTRGIFLNKTSDYLSRFSTSKHYGIPQKADEIEKNIKMKDYPDVIAYYKHLFELMGDLGIDEIIYL